MKPHVVPPGTFEGIYLEHSDAIYRFAFRLSGNREDAEDLTAETFCEAFQSWSRFRSESKPRTWLYRIAVNRWRMCRRRKLVKQVPLSAADSLADRIQGDSIQLDEALASLPDKLREAFLLVKSEGLTHLEAATALGVPVGTVYTRVFRAVAALRCMLDDESETQSVAVTARCDHGM
ncbi:MAG: RNA polymerase sigma factor [Fimbriimonas sp.]|nr:RNA polymerase sigma factor [Fimbriimonas sp.]